MTPTPAQEKAIRAHDPRTVVIAGPGSGKTATMVLRIAHDISTGRIETARTAVITFTNAAADELKRRLQARETPLPEYIGTLHGFCLRHLQRRRNLAVLPADAADNILEFQIAKHRLKTTVKKVRAVLTGTGTGRPDPQTTLALKVYRQILREENAIDYDLILADGLKEIEWNGSWCRHIYVDEYQDSGLIDAAIYEALEPTTAFIVGDPDQSIYAFRGGRPQNLTEEAHAKNTTLVILEDNYRSQPAICHAANEVIRNNSGRIAKDIVPTRKATGETNITRMLYATETEERSRIVANIADAIEHGEDPANIAVLVRYNAERKRITEELEAHGLINRGSQRMPADWKVAIAALRAMAAPDNAMTAAQVNAAYSGKGWEAEYAEARANKIAGKPLIDYALLNVRTATEARAALRQIGCSFATQKRMEEMPGSTPTELADAMTEQLQPAAKGVTVATYHGSKGLEWPIVYLPAAEDGRIGKEVDEERRLFFVAMTRAEDQLHISAALKRKTEWGNSMAPTGGMIRFAKEFK